MKTIIIGGGKGCKALLELTTGSFLKELVLEVQCVVDVNPEAPGMVYAREHGIGTCSSLSEALSMSEIELMIELTGNDELLEEIYKMIPTGIKLIDHTFAHVFWDLVSAREKQEIQLDRITRLEKRVDKERRFLQSIFDQTPDMMAVLDKDKNVLRLNRQFSEFVKKSPEEMRGRHCSQLLDEVDIGCECLCNEDCPFYESLLNNDPIPIIKTTPPPNETHWEVTQSVINNDEGKMEGILFHWHKITEEVILRRKMKSAEERFSSLISSAQDLISIKDRDGHYMMVNPSTAEAFNLKPIDFISKYVHELLPDHLANTIEKHDKEVIRTGKYMVFEEIIPVKGIERAFHTVRFPLKDYEGEIIGTCTIARDVSEVKALQDQLVQAEKMAAVGKLAAGVAHEINNPLTGILAYAEDMADEIPEDDILQEDLSVIIRETLRCRDIVRNLLDFARQENPKIVLTDPTLVLKQTLDLVHRLPTFRNIDLEVQIEENIPEIPLDDKQIQQVLLNFILNAVEIMHGKGKIYLTLRMDYEKEQCIIEVEDTGPGIPDNLVDKVFEPFFSTKGTSGLGLAVSWGIIERHQGQIEIDEGREDGAVFRFMLPIRDRRSTTRS